MPKTDDDMQAYCNCLYQISQRLGVVRAYRDGELSTGVLITDVEFLCLQYRKICELIAFSSLVANRTEYQNARAAFHKDWRAKKILKAVETINPHFYPIPYHKVGRTEALAIKTAGFLTRTELEEVYDRCSSLLHEPNPYADNAMKYEEYKTYFPIWYDKIIELLDCHMARFPQRKQAFWAFMDSGRGKPIVYGLKEKKKPRGR